MKISTRGRYAIRILLDIAANQGDGHVIMKDIVRRQQISKKYAEQIAMQLTQAGLLTASRGPRGGYRLVPPAGEVTVLQVVELMEGSLAPVQCLETAANRCERRSFCMTLPLWVGLGKVVREYLATVTLQSLIDQAPQQPAGSEELLL